MSAGEFGSQTRPDASRSFEFEVVTVDQRGEVIERQTLSAREFVEDLGQGVHLEMIAIPGGLFWMGSRAGEGYDDERPQHMVRVPPFWMGKYPVTQAQWRAVMGWLPPCRSPGANRPVDRITLGNAQAFCARLSRMTGRAYGLPSEAQREYACRAGTTTPFYCGATITTDLANYVGNHTFRSEPAGIYRHSSTEVGYFPPNPFGLYDMHGNVWEWCVDTWHDDYQGAPTDGSAWARGDAAAHVLRGGCWHDPPDLLRSATRLKQAPLDGEDWLGFRVALASLETGAAHLAGGNGRPFLASLKHTLRRLRGWLGR